MIIQASATQIPLADKSVQTVVTSPPYWGLRDYGVAGQIGLEPTPELYVEHIVEVFREVKRVLKDNGTIWVNLGDSYAGHNLPGWRDGNEAKNGGVSNKNGVGYVSGLKPKDLVGIPWMVAFALRADGWYLRSDIIWSKPNPMPESVTDRPTKAHEYIFLLAKQERYYFDQEAVREPWTCDRDDMRDNGIRTGLGYLQQGPIASNSVKSKRPDGWASHEGGHGSIHRNGRENGAEAMIDPSKGRNLRSVWTVATQPYSEAHFATFPEDLIKPCILAGCPVGGIVLDPFVGSGTTVQVAQDLGRIGIGLDLKLDYLQMAQRRSAQQGLCL